MTQFNLTQEAMALRVGKKQSTIANKLRLLNLPPEIRTVLKEKQLTERHGRALLKLKNKEQQEQVLKLILKNGWNVKQTADSLGTDRRTRAAADAQPCVKADNRVLPQSLRIRAPFAVQRTACQKNRGTNPIPVIDGKRLHLHQITLHSHSLSFFFIDSRRRFASAAIFYAVLKFLMCISCHDGILHGFRQIDKLRTVTCYTNQQVSVIFGVCLCILQHLVGNGVELHMECAQCKIGLEHCAEVCAPSLCCNQIVIQTQVQQCLKFLWF